MAGNKFIIPIAYKSDKTGLTQAENDLSGFGKTVAKIGAAVAGAFAVGAIIDFGKQSILAAEGVQEANNRIDAIAKSMDLFGSQTKDVTDRLKKYAESNELVFATDAEVIKATQAKLLTFANLAKTADQAGGAFDRATQAAVDMAAAGFGEAEQNAVQLGKALQDPINGITALSRSGITFTEDQKKVIESLVETGRVGEAQNMVLAAIETQVKGTAEATAKASTKMQLAFDNVKESVGAALMPTFEKLIAVIVPLVDKIAPLLAKAFELLSPIFDMLIEAITPLIDTTLPILENLFTQLSPLIAVVADVLKILMPIVIQLITAFAPLIDAVLPLLVQLLQFIVPVIKAVADIITWLIDTAIKPMVEWLKEAVNWLKDFLSLGANTPYQGQGGMPNLQANVPSYAPYQKAFADGGIVTRPTVGLVGEAGPEAIIPLNKANNLGTTVVINGNVGYDAVELAREIARRQAQAFSLTGLNRLVGVA